MDRYVYAAITMVHGLGLNDGSDVKNGIAD